MANNLRITGLASGMDIDKMVTDMMNAKRIPLNKLNAQKQIHTWQREQYQEMNKKVAALKTKSSDLILTASSLNARKVSSSNTSAVSATAASGASSASLSVTISRLATASSVVSTGAVSRANPDDLPTAALVTGSEPVSIDTSQTMANLGISAGTVKINDQSFTIDTSKTLDSLLTSINTNKAAGVLMTQNADGTFKVTSKDVGADARVSLSTSGSNLFDTLKLSTGTQYGDGTLSLNKPLSSMGSTTAVTGDGGVVSFRLNGVAFSFNADTDDLNDVINSVNASKAGVSARYDSASDTFSIVSKETGTSPIDIQNLKGNFLEAMKIAAPEASHQGLEAAFSIDGQSISSRTNSYTFNGTTLNFVSTTTSAVTVTVAPDVDKMVEAVKGFVDSYNDAVGLMGTRLGEKRYRDYEPLTEEQKTDMKDTDIKLWEDKAKSGIIRDDSQFRSKYASLLSATQNAVTDLVGQANSLKAIGIKSGSQQGLYDIASSGKLTLDETALRKALTEDPDAVARVFNYDGGGSTDASKMGIARKVQSAMIDFDKYIWNKAGAEGTSGATSSIGKQITAVEDKIKATEERLQKTEDQYYAKFGKLEDLMARLNNQASYLTGMFNNNQ